VPSTHTGLALDVLGDILLHPLMDSASVELERKVIEQEILAFQDSPDDVVSDELLKLVFGNDPVAANPLGTLESVKSLTRADLLDYYRQRFNGSGLVLSIAGDVDTAEVLQLAEKTFGTLPVGEALPTWGEPSRNCGRVVTERPTEQIYLAMALPGFAQYSRQSSVLNLVSSIFGGNMSSRLFQRAREKEALVYSIGSFPMTFSNTGILGVSASSSPQNADRVQEVIMDEIEIMRHDKISMVELQHAKDGILGGFLLSLESFFRRMHRNAGELYMRGTIRSVGEIAELVNSITLGEAMEIIDNVFDSSRLAVSVVHGPADS
jgi:predicted Zn-dependent peptidase